MLVLAVHIIFVGVGMCVFPVAHVGPPFIQKIGCSSVKQRFSRGFGSFA